MASRQLSRSSTGSCRLLMGRGWAADDQLARGGERPLPPHRMAKGRPSGRTCTVLAARRTMGTAQPPSANRCLFDPPPGFPSAGNRYAIHSAPLCRGHRPYPTIHGGPDEPERSGFGPFPITRSCRAWISGRALTDATNAAQIPVAHGICPRNIGHAEAKSFRPGSRSRRPCCRHNPWGTGCRVASQVGFPAGFWWLSWISPPILIPAQARDPRGEKGFDRA